MKIILRRTDDFDIDLELLAQAVEESIRCNIERGQYGEPLDVLVETVLKDHNAFSGALDDLELYDNYEEVLIVITKNMLQWCAENNTQFYDIMIEYDKHTEEELGL